MTPTLNNASITAREGFVELGPAAGVSFCGLGHGLVGDEVGASSAWCVVLVETRNLPVRRLSLRIPCRAHNRSRNPDLDG